jgi:WD40 repeat protein
MGEEGFSQAGHLFGRMAGDTQVRFLHGDSGGPLRDAPTLRTRADRPGPSLDPGRVLYRNTVTAEVIDLESGEIRRLEPAPPLEAALLLSDGGLLTVEDGVLTREGAPPLRAALAARTRGPAARVSVMAVDEDASLAILGFLDGWSEVHALGPLGRVDAVRLGAGMVVDAALGPDGAWAAAIDERGGTWIWPVGEPQARQRLPGAALQVTFADPQTLVVLGSRLRRWALPSPSSLGRLAAPKGVTNLDWADDTLAVSLAGGSVRAWTGSDQPARSWRWFGDIVTKDVALSPDGAQLWATALGVETWGGALSDPVGAPVPGFPSGCRRVVWLEPDLLVCAPFQDGPRVGRLGGALLPELSRPGLVVFDAEPAPDRRRAVLAADSGEVLLLDAGASPTLRPLFTDPEVRAVAVTEDGARVVTALSSSLQMRDLTGAAIWEQPSATRLRDVAVSPGDRLVVGGERGGRARVWRAADGALLAVLSGHDERVQAVAFSPDGARLATGSWDDTVRLWDLAVLDRSPDDLLGEVEATWGLSLAEALSTDAGL